jgi:hypothetical protein
MGKAVALIEEAIGLEPGDAHLQLLALKYSLRLGDIPGSRRHLAHAAVMPGCTPEQLLPLKSELAFLEKDWAALHSLLGETQPMASGPLAAICRFWSGPNP